MAGDEVGQNRMELLRTKAVSMRLRKKTLNQIQEVTGLSHPSIISAYKKFLNGGWRALESKKVGRPAGAKFLNELSVEDVFYSLLKISSPLDVDSCIDEGIDYSSDDQFWTPKAVQAWLKSDLGESASIKSVQRYLQGFGLIDAVKFDVTRDQVLCLSTLRAVPVIYVSGLRDIKIAGDTFYQIYVTDLRNSSRWMHYKTKPTVTELLGFLNQIIEASAKPIALVSRYPFVDKVESFRLWREAHSGKIEFIAYEDVVHKQPVGLLKRNTSEQKFTSLNKKLPSGENMPLTHLQRLEAESIQIMREVIAETENPVMLYSIGKDSAVMLHIAMKAFYPSLPPFPLMHVDTTWKFQDMYAFRDKMVKDLGLELITHTNPEGLAKGINPFTHGSAIHTDVMKTEGLKQALDKYGFDAAFGGARRDEEKSRAKERICSFRTADHRWDPKQQRPELWKQYNAKKQKGESIRVFPISNWTELDIWQYIHLEGIPIVPLYYSAERPVVERDGSLIMVDDDRMPLKEGEVPMMKHVRFRTLGCYPLTGAVESKATTLPEIIQEMLLTKTSERQGRVIDHDSAASMEKKKQEGYF